MNKAQVNPGHRAGWCSSAAGPGDRIRRTAPAAIAVPDTRRYRSLVGPALLALRQLSVNMFWVQQDGKGDC